MNYSNINDTALVDVIGNETLPTRDTATKERTFTKGEIQVLNPMKPSFEKAKKELQDAQTGLKACTDEFSLIKDAVTTATDDHKNAIEKNLAEQEQLKKDMAEQTKLIEFIVRHPKQDNADSVKKARAAHNGNSEGWFKKNRQVIFLALGFLIVDLVVFAVSFSTQREAFATNVILSRFGCVMAISVLGVVTHHIFTSAKTWYDKLVLGSLMVFTLGLSLVTILHALAVVWGTTGSIEATDFSLDLVESAVEATDDRTFMQRFWQGVVETPGIAELIVAACFTLLSCLYKSIFISPTKTVENSVPQQQTANYNMLDYFVETEKHKQQMLVEQHSAKVAAAAALNSNFETAISAYNDRLSELSATANKWSITLTEAKARLAYLVDEAMQNMANYRTVFCKLYCEKNATPSVAYEPVTKTDLEKYFNI